MTEPRPHPDDDDALADALADAWIEQAATNPALRRAALRAVGLLKEPADMTTAELAREQGTDRHGLTRIAQRAIKRLRYCPELSHLKSSPKP